MKSITNEDDPFFGKSKAAAYISLSLRTIDKMLACGELTGYRVRGKVLLRRSELDAFVENRRIDRDSQSGIRAPRRPGARP